MLLNVKKETLLFINVAKFQCACTELQEGKVADNL